MSFEIHIVKGSVQQYPLFSISASYNIIQLAKFQVLH